MKYYLIGFRNRGIFYEAATNQILDDLVARLPPAPDDRGGRLLGTRRDEDDRDRDLHSQLAGSLAYFLTNFTSAPLTESAT